MTKVTRTRFAVVTILLLAVGGLFLAGRAVARFVTVHQEQAASQQAAAAIERDAALKERRRAAAMNVPLVSLGKPSLTKAPTQDGTSVHGSTPGKLDVAQSGSKIIALSPVSPVQRPDVSRPGPAFPETDPKAVTPNGVGPMDLMQARSVIAAPPVPDVVKTGSISRIAKELPPPLEEAREKQEKRLGADQDTIRIVTGFECSTPLDVQKIGPTHFALTITTDTTLRNWFMFRVEGAKGKTVRIDLKDVPLGRWWSLNPVYSHVSSIDALESFATTPGANANQLLKAHNGPLLPDTTGQKWHFMPNVWSEQAGWNGSPGTMKTPAGQLCVVHTFDEDNVFVAMKVPYTSKHNEAYLASLHGRAGVKVVEVGRSKEGRPLQVVQIGEGNPKQVPCVLMYAREHPSENDTSWAVRGAIEWLSGNDPEAQELRRKITLIAIPVLDPDGAVAGKYEVITKDFAHTGEESPEAKAFAGYFKAWMDVGNRLDLSLNLHNVESAEGLHVFSPGIEPAADRQAFARSLHRGLCRAFTQSGYAADEKANPSRVSPFRLGGYLAVMYGPLFMPYELNSQQRDRHLTLEQMNTMGKVFVSASAGYLLSPDGELLRNQVDGVRRARNARSTGDEGASSAIGAANALQVEWGNWSRSLGSGARKE